MKKILQTVLKHHLEDVEMSKEWNDRLCGLCYISRMSLLQSDYHLFRKYLQKNVKNDIGHHVWDRDNTNTERQEWLIKHINLN